MAAIQRITGMDEEDVIYATFKNHVRIETAVALSGGIHQTSPLHLPGCVIYVCAPRTSLSWLFALILAGGGRGAIPDM